MFYLFYFNTYFRFLQILLLFYDNTIIIHSIKQKRVKLNGKRLSENYRNQKV